MKKLYTLGLVSLLLMTSFVFALSYSSLFVEDNPEVTVVYGANAASSDVVGSTDISNKIVDYYYVDEDQKYIFDGSGGLFEDEIILGGSVAVGKISEIINDNKLPGLLDSKIRWDDGLSSENEFNIHEEIMVNGLRVETTLDDVDFNGITITNDKGIFYKYVFEEDMNRTRIGHEDADDLYLQILGEEYEIENMDSNSITLITSREILLNKGESYTVDGKTITVNAVGEDKAYINDKVIREDSSSKVNGLEVKVVSVFRPSSDSGDGWVILKVGEEISKTIDDGDDYADNDDTWIWKISNPGKIDGFIGVQYNLRSNDNDEKVIVAGESYILPNNFAEIRFVETTDVEYTELEVYFDEVEVVDGGAEVPVLVLKADEDDSLLITTTGADIETNTVYFYYNITGSNIQMYYKDLDENELMATDGTLEFVFDDTIIDVDVSIGATKLILSLITDISKDTTSEISAIVGDTGAGFNHLGVTVETAETDELAINGAGIGTKDENIMDYYGIIINNPEQSSEKDEILIEIPNEQVYATVLISADKKTAIESNETVAIDLTSTDAGLTLIQKNGDLIVIGGPCINPLASQLLGFTGPVCAEEFTAATGISAGQYSIETYDNPFTEGKKAVLIMGYNAADTTLGVNEFLSTLS